MDHPNHRHALVGPPELAEMKRRFQIDFLKNAGLSPEHYLLDIGCGTLRGGIPLINHLDEAHYFGIDSRNEVIIEGKKELSECGLEYKIPQLLVAEDISKLTIDHKFDYVWAFSVLFHMNDTILDNTLDFVSRHLLDTGVFYANVNIGMKPEGFWQGFPVIWRNLEYYVEACSRHGLDATDLGTIRSHGHISSIEAQDSQIMLGIIKP